MTKKDKKKVKKKGPWWKRGLRILGRIVLALFIVFILLVLLIRSPWGQNLIVNKLTQFVSDKTNTVVSIKKLFITFSGDIYLEGLYLEDEKQDTLLYSDKLQAGIPLWPIIMGNPISIDGVEWSGLRANVVRKDTIEGFNFQFLIDAFASDSTGTEKVADTTSKKPPKISFGKINFSDFKVKFDDEVSGMKANLDLGTFQFKGKNFDLEKMKFEVAQLAIEDTKVSYEQTKRGPPSTDTTNSTLPYLSLGDFKLKNVTAHYKSVPDSMEADVDLSYLSLKKAKADLANNDIEAKNITLNNSNLQFKMKPKKKVENEQEEEISSPTEKEPFNWPDWDIRVESIALQNNHLKFQNGEEPENFKEFSPNYIDLKYFNFKVKDIVLSTDKSAKFNLTNLSFKENSGIVLKQLALNAALDSTSFTVDDLIIKTGNSEINADLETQFSSLQSFIDNPDKAELSLDLNHFEIDLNDAFTFVPQLKENEYLVKLSQHKFTGKINANGTLSKVNLSELLVNWGQQTSIKTHGKFINLTDIDNLAADIDNFKFKSTRTDLARIISEEDLGISIPERIIIESQFHGGLDDLKAEINLIVPEGRIKIDGEFLNKQEIAFKANINVIDFNLGKILKNPDIGTIAFEMNASGKGSNINELNAKLSSQFSKLEFNGYDFSALELNGKIDKGKGDIVVCYRDENLDLNLDSKILLDSISSEIELNFQLEGADLLALRITEKDVKTKLMMKAMFKGNTDEFDFKSQFTEGVIVYDKSNYYLGVIDLSAGIREDSTSFDISSNFLNAKLRSNANPERISEAIQEQLKSYFADSTVSLDTVLHPVNLEFNMKLGETKLLTKLFLPDINAMDTLDLSIDFDQQKRKLTANLSLPYLDYAEKTIDSLQFNLNSTAEAAEFKFGFNKLNAGPFLMHQTYFDGDLKNKLLSLHFHAFNEEKETYVVRTEVSGKASDLKIHFNSDELIFNGEPWTIPSDNEMNIQKDKIIAKNFVFSHNNESIEIANDLIQTTQNNIGIGFKNFKLANLLALFNKDDLLASGDFQGNIVAIDPFNNFGLNADFTIDNLTALQAELGKLTLKAKSESGDNYNLDLAVKGNDIDLAVKGDYSLKNKGSELDFKLDLNKIGMKTIATISGEALKDASGTISGEIAVQGDVSSPQYKGYLQFNDAEFNVAQLNSKFRLANDKIEIDNENITLNKFSIEDEQSNTFTLDGSITTESFTDPLFDLSINAKNFQALNSTKKDNDVFYGDVNFDMDGTIKGNMSAPIVKMNIAINEKTDFTYAIQSSQAKLEKSDGIVEFVNKANPDDILTRINDSTEITSFGGIELHVKLHIDQGANFNAIVDPQTGDDLNISGKADLDFNINKNGIMTLTGRYDIQDGHYNLSLYNLVKRKFKLQRGSSVIWRGGDPLEAEMNVTAKYSVDAAATGLMAAQTAGASEEVQNKYRQRLPFFVYLNVKGELDEPQLNFSLDMPEDYRGAIDGSVYGRIKQVNSDEEELNKQVFSLLVLKKFYPSSGSDGSGGGAEQLVRKKVNEALSDQLNAFSNKLMGNTGVELDFGLNSYTDYQGESVQQRTDLNISAQKKLLDDRLIVQVGSNVNVEGDTHPGEETPIVGNASIQYLLTEDGRWRLKGFRNNEFENVIDGQVFVNGISVIFQRQFNKWNELFANPPKEEESSEDLKSVEDDDDQDDEKTNNKEKKTKSDKKDKN